MLPKFLDLTGKRFGKLTVIERAETKYGKTRWKCLCDCGNYTYTITHRLTSGATQSCGCRAIDNHPIKHGMKGTRLYETWQGMKKRCNNPNSKSYKRYGAQGIKVCPEWENDFQAFCDWAMAHGYTDELTIDRIDNQKGYSPDNCRWVSWGDQAKNKKCNILIEHNGETKILSDWCREYGKKVGAASQRYREMAAKGEEITLEKLFYEGDYRIKKVNQYTIDGVFLRQWPSLYEAERNGFKHTSVSSCCRGKRRTAYGFVWSFSKE